MVMVGKAIRYITAIDEFGTATGGCATTMRTGMGRRVEEEREWDDEESEEDEGDESLDGEEEPTIPCSYCRQEIYEDSVRCPHCGQYLSEEDLSASRKPWWIILGVVLCILVVWFWIAH
jgi:hypothetical protein